MSKKLSARERAIRRRNRFLALCAAALILLVIAVILLVKLISGSDAKPEDPAQKTGSKNSSLSSVSETPEENTPQYVQRGAFTLDASYCNLLLVNGWHPLPDDYDYEGNLVTIDEKYRQPGYDLTQFDRDAYPYLEAMCEAAQQEGVPLKVCSPYRSYAIQERLFKNQVQKWVQKGLSADEADRKAATVVARPGTSEHHTGLAADFIRANDEFETYSAFAWLQEHAAEYGFIMRYPKSKEEITGVIYESWHYRFVGINEAMKIQKSGLCLEEYLEKTE